MATAAAFSAADAASLRTTAVRDGDDFVLNGSKAFISGAGAADVYFIMTRTGEPGSGPGGITCFLVDEDNPPMVLSNGQVYSKGGLDAIARHSEQEGGLVVTCPRTGDVCLLGTAVRAFLA